MTEIEWFMRLSGVEQLAVVWGFALTLGVIIIACQLIYNDKKQAKKTAQKELKEKYGKMS